MRARRAGVLVVLAGAVGWATARGIDGGLLFVAPALLLALPLLLGRYVGEQRMLALLRPLRRARAVRAPARLGTRRSAPVPLYRASELIARSLAVRPPPLTTA